MPENEGELVVPSLVANPMETGGLRLDPASADPAYRQRLRDCFYGDADPPRCTAAAAWSQAAGCCLAAVPAGDTLTAYPLAVVDQAIRARGAFPHAQGGQP